MVKTGITSFSGRQKTGSRKEVRAKIMMEAKHFTSNLKLGQ